MLNISPNKLNEKVDLSRYTAAQKVFHKRHYKHFNRFLLSFAIIGIVVLFLPWTQNISGEGYLTTLDPDQRPQTIQSPIPGRIEKWYVREGDYVKKGDTILFMSEVKNEYFDPKLIERTGQQIQAKNMAVSSYQEKMRALHTGVLHPVALQVTLERLAALKLGQVAHHRNKDFLGDVCDYVVLTYS